MSKILNNKECSPLDHCYMVIVDMDGRDGHTEELEIEVVLYDPETTEDKSDTKYMKFKSRERMKERADLVESRKMSEDELLEEYKKTIKD